MVKNLPASVEDIGDMGLEEHMAIHSGILTWKTPWMEKSGQLQLMGSQKVRHDLVTEQQQYYKYSHKSSNLLSM